MRIPDKSSLYIAQHVRQIAQRIAIIIIIGGVIVAIDIRNNAVVRIGRRQWRTGRANELKLRIPSTTDNCRIRPETLQKQTIPIGRQNKQKRTFKAERSGGWPAR